MRYLYNFGIFDIIDKENKECMREKQRRGEAAEESDEIIVNDYDIERLCNLIS